MKRGIFIIIVLTLLAALYSCSQQLGEPVFQTSLPRIDQMPDMPEPYKIIDWRKKARQFDSLAFSFDNTAPYGPLIWLDSSRRKL